MKKKKTAPKSKPKKEKEEKAEVLKEPREMTVHREMEKEAEEARLARLNE